MKRLVNLCAGADCSCLAHLGAVEQPWEHIPGSVLLETDASDAEICGVSEVEGCFDPELEFGDITSQPIYWQGPNTDDRTDDRWGLASLSSPGPLTGPWPATMTYDYATTGAGVIAYMMDGTPGEIAQLAGRLTIIFNAHPSAGPGDHGTAVAALIGGTRDGVAKDVQIRCAVVTGANGSGTLSQIISGGNAILGDYAGRPEPGVVNISLGGESATNPLAALLTAFRNAGLLVVAGAGNNNRDIGVTPIWPASAPNVIAVGAMTVFHTRASFSNYGAPVDIWAPGDDENIEGWTKRSYLAGGTSFASPDVAGIGARLLEGRGRLDAVGVDALTAEILGLAKDDAIMPAGTTGRVAFIPGGVPLAPGAGVCISITA